MAVVTAHPGLYDETIGLLVAARDYCAEAAEAEAAGLSPREELLLSLEAGRLARQLTAIMAWVIAIGDAEHGAMAMLQVPAPSATFSRAGRSAELDRLIGPRLRALLDATQDLSRRVARLDARARGICRADERADGR